MDLFEREDLLKREIWVYLGGSWHYWVECCRFNAISELLEAAQSGNPVMLVDPRCGLNLNAGL